MKQGLAPFTPRIDPALQCRWERCASFCFVERDSDSRGNLLVLNGVPGGLCPAPWADRPRLPICLNHAPKVVGAMGGVDGFRGTSGKNLQSVGCCKKERKNNEKKNLHVPFCPALRGAPGSLVTQPGCPPTTQSNSQPGSPAEPGYPLLSHPPRNLYRELRAHRGRGPGATNPAFWQSIVAVLGSSPRQNGAT